MVKRKMPKDRALAAATDAARVMIERGVPLPSCLFCKATVTLAGVVLFVPNDVADYGGPPLDSGRARTLVYGLCVVHMATEGARAQAEKLLRERGMPQDHLHFVEGGGGT